MNRQMLRSKIHRISVTECNVEYEGSLTLDTEIMREAGMVPYERIDVYDVDNANRFSTYLIEGRPGSGDCCVNGAAARLVELGDKLILASYCSVEDADVGTHRPQIVLVGEANKITEIKRAEAAGVRV
ncbi:MAG: aspartate 1-decarboxylase, partial [Acidobacteria bacterium]|nr:aspartate 1-decarboxylase [Acidobacteriota bacterium]NIM63778.1 aspartate 1-decarboxylase [Acidobacteriota bacterium]NIO60395.1 aspartate 1-decarboxylase [Acidobacteriota bacterium]NIQ30361.1 aspartate 1-decarboxylase [Acidobacteriota bacterium]NIQ86724.1 aspartate 1-decarboxylase [Acidobacteriota bacterium]